MQVDPVLTSIDFDDIMKRIDEMESQGYIVEPTHSFAHNDDVIDLTIILEDDGTAYDLENLFECVDTSFWQSVVDVLMKIPMH